MSSMMEVLVNIKQEKTKRLFFLSCWTLNRWNQADKFGGGLDSNIKHNVIDILCLTTHFRSVAREEDGGLAFYPVTNKEMCTAFLELRMEGKPNKRCSNMGRWQHSDLTKSDILCDEHKVEVEPFFPDVHHGKWEKIEGG